MYYSFERQSGATIFDDSGNNIDASVNSLAQVTKESGKCGSGLHLNQGWLCCMLKLVRYEAISPDSSRVRKV